ncbi:MAG TPA: ABC transporter permease [Urbifossiella sp.]|nr:ABC transporter permease [Urbifossiella sp.]
MPLFPIGGAKLRRSISLAVKSLWLHKLRSVLSVLGIIIGTWSVISLMAFGEGSMREALADIKRQGATNIVIRSVKPPDDSATASKGWVTTYGLVNLDLKRLETLDGSITRVVPMRIFPTEARYLDRMANTRVIGTVPEYAVVNKLEMARGRFLFGSDDPHPGSDEENDDVEMNDNLQLLNVCVLGSEAADKLFPFEDPIDKMVQMKSMRFRVVGVVKERMPTGGTGGSLAAEDYNRDVYIPFKTSTARFGSIISVRSSGARMNEKVDISQVTLTVDADVDNPAGREKVKAVGNEIKRMLVQYHFKKDYAVTIPLDKLEEAEKSQNRFTNLLLMIASISLVVGGIGIMNIMLATVTERTREIGIRRALGAKRRDIVTQFLVEAVVQTSVGGIFGVIFGLGTVFSVPMLWKWLAAKKTMFFASWFSSPTLPAEMNISSIFLSLGVSIFIGVVFGLYPAWRAAKLDPIEALRHD